MVRDRQNLQNPPRDGDKDADGWTYKAGHWYAPGYEGLTSPFDREQT